MKTLRFLGLLAMLCTLQIPADALAQKRSGTKPPSDPTSDPVMLSAGFLSAHPDLRFRLMGLEEIKQGKYEDAIRFFQRAAYYADKPSQGMVAEMLWNGQGIAKNPAMAYAWMDLAAERGYEGFLVLRERYWDALDEAQREYAVREGETLYAKFGDSAAQPRLATVLRRERRKMTGSRTGFAGNVQIFVPGPAGHEQIDGSKFFDERYWDPQQYQAWHDSIWKKPRVGRVSVGDVEQIQRDMPASRIPTTAPNVDADEPETPQRDESRLGTQKDT